MTKYRIDKYAEGNESPIVAIEILRETTATYHVLDTWKVMKASSPIFDSFELARAEYILQRKEAIATLKFKIRSAQTALERAEKLLAEAPYLNESVQP